MWKIYSSGFPLLLATLIAVNAEAEIDFKKSFKDFAVELYGNITESQENQNVVFSPASVQSAAVLAFMGAAGKTEADMASGLLLPTNDKEIVANAFGEMLLKYKNHSMVTSDQKIYIKEGVSYKRKFHELAEGKLDTAVEHINFIKNEEAAKKINNWVDIKTHGKINGIVNKDSLGEDTSSIILNVLYLKGNWDKKFPKDQTSKGKFWTSEADSVQVDLMKNSNDFLYAEWPKLKARGVKLLFADTKLSMILIIPNEKTGLKFVEEAIKTTPFETLSSFRWKRVDLEMPKFKVEWDIIMNNVFEKMGMSSMFHDANFSEMGPNIKVSEIIHKAVLEVNEEGAEASAVTAVMFSAISSNPEIYSIPPIRADRPFMYLITGESEEILFAGRFVKP